MMRAIKTYPMLLAMLCLVTVPASAQDNDFAVSLPNGVNTVWNLKDAYRESTPTRERLCINGLWRWQPADARPDKLPDGSWGFFKVPGCWPGVTDYMQKDCQTLYAHPAWKARKVSDAVAAWYEREITVPNQWKDRRIAISVEYLNSLAEVYIDGKRVGEIPFPGGELDATEYCVPGQTHKLTLHVLALPLNAVLLSYNDSNAAREKQGRVERRGLCGDVFLKSSPRQERISNVKVDTSVRKGELQLECQLENLDSNKSYSLVATVKQGSDSQKFTSPPFPASGLKGQRYAFTTKWMPKELWDIHTPQNKFDLEISLVGLEGKTADTFYTQRSGFREFWIDGKDFYLNGTRIFLSVVPLDNAQVGAAQASYEGARESFRRLKSFGINFVYTHNYGCEPGSHLSFAEILRAADDEGVLVSFSQPHFSHYDWKSSDADRENGYARHAEFYVHAAQNHPAVVAYSMSHNACGYGEDMNPDMIDGLKDPRSASYERDNASRALRAEAIVKGLDPQRIVYHHAGGDIGSMHTINFYPNFVPIQEMSDWFEHWSTVGVKPAFLCEYGAPFLWDWGMYRGWYKGEREFGSAAVPWDFCLAEWNSQFLGDQAFEISELEKTNLRWEAKQFREGRLWHRWDYPQSLNSKKFDERFNIIAQYITDNWRSYRTWGLSAFSPWEHESYWRVRDGVNRQREQLAVDWQSIQRPGFSADYLDQRYERMDMAFEMDDWEPTAAAKALLRNNMPLLGYIAGKPDAFTSKDHVFAPGEWFQKQAIVINNSRQTVQCTCTWKFALPQPISGSVEVSVATGDQARIPLTFKIPEDLPSGTYKLQAEFQFSSGGKQSDSFFVHVIPAPKSPIVKKDVAVFDPHGETSATLESLGIDFKRVDAIADLSGFEMLIVGKAALTVDGPAPDITQVRDGLEVILFEQTGAVLEKRFGFRVAEYGARLVFPRVPDHPLLAGIDSECFRDWRGASTLLPSKLEYKMRPRHGPTVEWCGIEVPRLWRCGNRGNVASVLIEKPPRGDFRPIVDCGFGLQYSPLMEYREGRGMILFCQMDVTARSEVDPVAASLLSNVLRYASSWQPEATRGAVYLGESAGKIHLERSGFELQPFPDKPNADQVLVIGPSDDSNFADKRDAIENWIHSGGQVIGIGLSQAAASLLIKNVDVREEEHIASCFDPFPYKSRFCGIGPADVHNRDPRKLPLIRGAATIFGDGVLAQSSDANIVFCQMVPWQFDDTKQWNLKKTFRRSSYLLTRLMSNLGIRSSTPILERFHSPATDGTPRYLDGLYLDQPEEWDDPYRFFRW